MQSLRLIPGDTVAIVATARKVIEAEITYAINLLESWGLHVFIPDGLYAAENQMAGSDAHRKALFEQAWNHPQVKAILCGRGGYGTVRMADGLNLQRMDQAPLLIGYSDVTVLLNQLYRQHGVKSYHAPMAINMLPEKAHAESLAFLQHCLFNGPQPMAISKHVLNQGIFSTGSHTVLGGNLSVLYSLLGSNSFPELNHCYLFLEDLDEYLYHIERMMQGLKRAGAFTGIKGLLIGDMSDMKDNTIQFGESANEIIARIAAELQIPVVFGVPAGHEPRHLALLMGHAYSVKEQEGQITLVPDTLTA